jgi:hypothetical protein
MGKMTQKMDSQKFKVLTLVRSDRRLGMRLTAEELNMGICLQESLSVDIPTLYCILMS